MISPLQMIYPHQVISLFCENCSYCKRTVFSTLHNANNTKTSTGTNRKVSLQSKGFSPIEIIWMGEIIKWREIIRWGEIYGEKSMGRNLWGEINGEKLMVRNQWGEINGEKSMGRNLWGEIY